jgi:hypothetical protein
MNADPRWLEILKASGWQTLAIAAAFAALLALDRWKVIPPLPPWAVQISIFGFLLCTALTVVAVISWSLQLFAVRNRFVRWRRHAADRRVVRNYIPHMTSVEKEIISYLLEHNQKAFTGDSDGGYATTLISRGVIVSALRPNQVILESQFPFEILDHVWGVLVEHKAEFPYKPSTKPRDASPHPWRVHWMAR